MPLNNEVVLSRFNDSAFGGTDDILPPNNPSSDPTLLKRVGGLPKMPSSEMGKLPPIGSRHLKPQTPPPSHLSPRPSTFIENAVATVRARLADPRNLYNEILENPGLIKSLVENNSLPANQYFEQASKSLFQLACESGSTAATEYLLTKPLERTGTRRESHRQILEKGLFAAIRAGHTRIVDLLLNGPVSVHTQELSSQFTPLHIACSLTDEKKSLEMVKTILSKNPALNSQSLSEEGKIGDTPLAIAIKNKHFQVAKELIDRGAKIDFNNPLHEATLKGDLEAVKKLIHLGADMNRQEPVTQHTPLHLAVLHGHCVIAKALLKKGANGQKVNCTGLTPLKMALALGKTEMLDLFQNPDYELESPREVAAFKESLRDLPFHRSTQKLASQASSHKAIIISLEADPLVPVLKEKKLRSHIPHTVFVF